MQRFSKIAVIDSVHLSDFARKEIQGLSDAPVIFPDTNSKDEDEVISRIGDADCVLGFWLSIISKKVLDNCPNIKYIGICGTGITNVDLEEVKERGIVLKNVTDYGDEATAEYIFAQLLSLARGFGEYQWGKEACELNGKTLGIIGLGAVGKQVARLGLGFNMKVLYNSLERDEEWEKKGLIFSEKKELLNSSDVITLHVPKNIKILNEEDLGSIKLGAVLVDTSLGFHFDPEQFKTWIGKVENFAIFDGVNEEFRIFKGIKNVIGLDREFAGKTSESRDRLSQKVLDNIHQFLSSSITTKI